MTRFASFIVSLGVLLCPALAVSGANNAVLNCVSTANNGEKLRLTGSIPGDFSEFSLTLSSARSSLTLSNSSGTISVIDDFKNLMFTLSVTGKDQSTLLLYGLPKSMTHKAGLYGKIDATFAAVLKDAPSPDPKVKSSTSGSVISDVPLSCAYHYSI